MNTERQRKYGDLMVARRSELRKCVVDTTCGTLWHPEAGECVAGPQWFIGPEFRDEHGVLIREFRRGRTEIRIRVVV